MMRDQPQEAIRMNQCLRPVFLCRLRQWGMIDNNDQFLAAEHHKSDPLSFNDPQHPIFGIAIMIIQLFENPAKQCSDLLTNLDDACVLYYAAACIHLYKLVRFTDLRSDVKKFKRQPMDGSQSLKKTEWKKGQERCWLAMSQFVERFHERQRVWSECNRRDLEYKFQEATKKSSNFVAEAIVDYKLVGRKVDELIVNVHYDVNNMVWRGIMQCAGVLYGHLEQQQGMDMYELWHHYWFVLKSIADGSA